MRKQSDNGTRLKLGSNDSKGIYSKSILPVIKFNFPFKNRLSLHAKILSLIN